MTQSPPRYGCHCDIEAMPEGFQPDGCVFDDGIVSECTYALKLQREGKGRDDCGYWRPVAAPPAPAAPAPDADGLIARLRLHSTHDCLDGKAVMVEAADLIAAQAREIAAANARLDNALTVLGTARNEAQAQFDRAERAEADAAILRENIRSHKLVCVELARAEADIAAARADAERMRAALVAAGDEMHVIKRISEMSAEIMRDPVRTGNWAGSERTAKQFVRLAVKATATRDAARGAARKGDA